MGMFLTRGSPSSDRPSKYVMVIPAIYSTRLFRSNNWVTKGDGIETLGASLEPSVETTMMLPSS